MSSWMNLKMLFVPSPGFAASVLPSRSHVFLWLSAAVSSLNKCDVHAPSPNACDQGQCSLPITEIHLLLLI